MSIAEPHVPREELTARRRRAPVDVAATGRARPRAVARVAATRVAVARVALAAVGLATLACSKAEHPLRRVQAGDAVVTGRGMLVIAIDGLRYDRTTMGGHSRDTTPYLTQLASEGVSFTDTWSAIPLRFDSHVSLLTGCDPLIARRRTFGADGAVSDEGLPPVVPLTAPGLAIRFLASGWTTAAFLDHPDFKSIHGLDRGFREFIEYAGRGAPKARPGEGVLGVGGRFIQWMNRRRLDENWFAYLHMGDLERVWANAPPAHVPAEWQRGERLSRFVPTGDVDGTYGCLPPSKVGSGCADLADLEMRYDCALRNLDASLQRILYHVDEFGRRDLVTVVVVGAFGMPFGENGMYLMASMPDAPDSRVPWVIRPAADLRLPAGREVDAVASLLDVAPTLLELAGLSGGEAMHGLSRAAEARDSAAPAARRTLFVRGGLHGSSAIVTEQEHWALMHPSSARGARAESWTGSVREDPALALQAMTLRSGPAAADPLRWIADGEVVTPAFAARRDAWVRWERASADARNAIRAGRDAQRELAQRLRELQSTEP